MNLPSLFLLKQVQSVQFLVIIDQFWHSAPNEMYCVLFSLLKQSCIKHTYSSIQLKNAKMDQNKGNTRNIMTLQCSLRLFQLKTTPNLTGNGSKWVAVWPNNSSYLSYLLHIFKNPTFSSTENLRTHYRHYLLSRLHNLHLHNSTNHRVFGSQGTGKKGREDSGPAATSHLPVVRFLAIKEAWHGMKVSSVVLPSQESLLWINLFNKHVCSTGAWERGSEPSPFTQDFSCEITTPSIRLPNIGRHNVVVNWRTAQYIRRYTTHAYYNANILKKNTSALCIYNMQMCSSLHMHIWYYFAIAIITTIQQFPKKVDTSLRDINNYIQGSTK